jgi:hypothetical protein
MIVFLLDVDKLIFCIHPGMDFALLEVTLEVAFEEGFVTAGFIPTAVERSDRMVGVKKVGKKRGLGVNSITVTSCAAVSR